MRRRNILALLTAAALCLCLLAGCGSAETTDSTGTSREYKLAYLTYEAYTAVRSACY